MLQCVECIIVKATAATSNAEPDAIEIEAVEEAFGAIISGSVVNSELGTGVYASGTFVVEGVGVCTSSSAIAVGVTLSVCVVGAVLTPEPAEVLLDEPVVLLELVVEELLVVELVVTTSESPSPIVVPEPFEPLGATVTGLGVVVTGGESAVACGGFVSTGGDCVS
ncbi:hypothetical protein G195_003270 [Phytophthora kernoviae 00238/432]|nr:hypothetical protein G195_003270 [Phytophthora kernoviae 00238/432]KAG2524636.1 hypothetical protein JM16_002187 [Phytophthora kernoviae]